MMKCGHTANCEKVESDGTRKPYCFFCDCDEVMTTKPDLTGRKAKCSYYGKTVYERNNETYYPELMTKNAYGKDCCGSIVDSSYGLPFFHHKPDSEYDEFYCGCQSWD